MIHETTMRNSQFKVEGGFRSGAETILDGDRSLILMKDGNNKTAEFSSS
jgi:hypothetical protein